MKRTILILFALISALHLAALLFLIPPITSATKPLLVITLLAYYFFSTTHRSTVVMVGLLLCWAGDMLLMLTGELYFMMGLLAFLMGHICYIIAYRQHRHEDAKEELLPTQKIRLSMPVILAGTGLIVVLYPKLGSLQIPVLIYGIIIMVMVMNALFRHGRTSSTSFWMVFGGALLFQISDSLLAINKFYSTLSLGDFWVMITYIGAQFFIVQGLVEHDR